MKTLLIISSLALLSFLACKVDQEDAILIEPYDFNTSPPAAPITILDSGYVKAMVDGVITEGPVWLWDSKDPYTRKQVKTVAPNQLVYITIDDGDYYRVFANPNDMNGGYILKGWIELVK